MTIRLCRSSPLIQETGGRMNFQPVHVWGSVHHEIFFFKTGITRLLTETSNYKENALR